MPRRGFAIATIVLCLAACESRNPETPVQAVQSIIELYETRDFDALIRTRYAELSKAENEQQIEALVDRFRSMYSDDEDLQRALAVYESLSSQSLELSEDGNVATFSLATGFVKLSRMPDGRWGFHL